MLNRQFCIFYHYYLVELFVQLSYIKLTLGHMELVFRLYHALALLIKYKSTYCISILSIHYKYLLFDSGTQNLWKKPTKNSRPSTRHTK